MTLPEALARLALLLKERGIRAMVIGGLANLRWGEPRSTLDIDVTVDASDDEVLELAGALGTVLVDEPRAFLERARVLPIRLPDGTTLDLIAATLPFERDAVARAVTGTLEGTELPICSAQDLILHKVISSRERDLSDVEGILRRQGDTIDVDGLRTAVAGLSADLEDPSILERFEAAVARASR